MGKIASLPESNPSTVPIDQASALFVWLLFGLTDLISFLLNLFTLIILIKCKSRFKGYLISLTLSDLLTAPVEPLTIASYTHREWPFHSYTCTLTRTLYSLNNKTTAMTVCFISIHRYLIVAYAEKDFKNWNSNYISLIIWLLGLLCSIPTALMYKKIDGNCKSNWTNEQLFYYRLTVKIMFIMTPVILMTIATLATIHKLWTHKKLTTEDKSTNHKLAANKLSAERSITIALASYVLCEVPSSMITLGSMMKPSRFYNQDACQTISCQVVQARFIIADWLPLAQSLLNPVVYYLMCKNFRTDMGRIFSGFGSQRGSSSNPIVKRRTRTRSSDKRSQYGASRGNQVRSSIISQLRSMLSFGSGTRLERNICINQPDLDIKAKSKVAIEV